MSIINLVKGKLHGLDGPAVVYRGGNQSWFINGKSIPLAEIKEIINDRWWVDYPYNAFTDDDLKELITILTLTYQ